MLIKTIIVLNWIILCFLILSSIGYIALLLMAIRNVLLRFEEVQIGDVLSIMRSDVLPPVTVMIAAYNEELSITEAVESILNSSYKETHIMVINDGSTDSTMQKLIHTYQLRKVNNVIPPIIQDTGKVLGYYLSDTHPTITVIDKEHRCKSDSLNVGLNACRTPFFMTFDADSIIEPDAISEMVFYMMTKPHAIAVGASIFILNGCEYKNGVMIREKLPRKYIAGVQTCEYLRSFLFNRAGWNVIQGALSYSGTGTLFEHKAVLEVGGFDLGNPANDFEVIVNLHAHKKSVDQIGFSPVAAIWTDVPSTLKEFWHQRTNWQMGMLRSLLHHRYMFFRKRFGSVGFFHYPFYLIAEVFGAVIEFTAYVLLLISWYLGIFNTYTVVLIFLICLGFVTLLTLSTVLMNMITYNKYGGLNDIPRILFYVLSEPIGFRQFSVFCRTVATIKYFFKRQPRHVALPPTEPL